MPPEAFLICPKCGHEYNVHRRVFDKGPDFTMFCPICNAEFPRKEARLAGASFPVPGSGSEG